MTTVADASSRPRAALALTVTVLVLSTAVALVLLGGNDPGQVTVGSGASTTQPTEPARSGFVAGRTGTVLVVPTPASGDRLVLQVVDVDAAEVRVSAPSSLGAAGTERPLVRAGRVVVVNPVEPLSSNLRTAWVFDDPLKPPRLLSGPHLGLDAFASTVDDRLWIVAFDDPSTFSGRVWEVDLTGHITSPERAFDANHVPVAAVVNGLVREVRSRQYGVGLQVWNPQSGTVVRTVASRDAFFLDAAGSTVAWLNGTDGLHLTDTVSGHDRVVTRPSDDVAFSTLARFSPDARYLAADTVDASAIGGPVPPLVRFGTDVPFPGRLVVVDVASATSALVPGSGTTGGMWRRNVTWSPGGDWLFYGPAELSLGVPPRNFSIFAYRLGASAPSKLPVDLRYGPLLAGKVAQPL